MISANEARKSLNTQLESDQVYLRLIEQISLKIKKAIESKKNYVRFEKSDNNCYNEEIYKLMKSKGYTVHTDWEYIYSYDTPYDIPKEKEFYVVYF